VLRGGSWNNNAENLRCANRNNDNPSNRNNNVGFRLCQHNFLPGVKRLRLFYRCIKLSNVPFLLLHNGNAGRRKLKNKGLLVSPFIFPFPVSRYWDFYTYFILFFVYFRG
jgi:hypothetical protein